MLIVTESGEAVNAQHPVRLFLQTDTDANAEGEPARCRLVLQLVNRQKITAAELSREFVAQALLRDVLRQWVQGQALIEIAACFGRIEKGEPAGTRRREVCL